MGHKAFWSKEEESGDDKAGRARATSMSTHVLEYISDVNFDLFVYKLQYIFYAYPRTYMYTHK